MSRVWVKLEGFLPYSRAISVMCESPGLIIMDDFIRTIHGIFPLLATNRIVAEQLLIKLPDGTICESDSLLRDYLETNTARNPLLVQVLYPVSLLASAAIQPGE